MSDQLESGSLRDENGDYGVIPNPNPYLPGARPSPGFINPYTPYVPYSSMAGSGPAPGQPITAGFVAQANPVFPLPTAAPIPPYNYVPLASQSGASPVYDSASQSLLVELSALQSPTVFGGLNSQPAAFAAGLGSGSPWYSTWTFGTAVGGTMRQT